MTTPTTTTTTTVTALFANLERVNELDHRHQRASRLGEVTLRESGVKDLLKNGKVPFIREATTFLIKLQKVEIYGIRICFGTDESASFAMGLMNLPLLL